MKPYLCITTGPGAEARNSIGTVLVSGMIVGTIFTLFVVPVFYALIAEHHRPATEQEFEEGPMVARPAVSEG